MERPDSRSRLDRVVRLVILLAALAAALWDLGGKSFWIDEVFTLEFSSGSVRAILTNTGETNPPLYYLLQHFWRPLAGESEAGVRLLSVVFGLSAVWLAGWVAGMFGGARLAWGVMGLTALSPYTVGFAQMARGYSLFLAAGLLSLGSLVRWLDTGRRRWGAAYVAGTLVMCWTHNYAPFVLLAQHLWMGWQILRRRVRPGGWALLTGAVLLGWAPWILVQVRQFLSAAEGGFWIPAPTWGYFLGSIRGMVLWTNLPPWLQWPYLALALAGLAALLLSGAGRAGGGRPRPGGGFVLLWFLCSTLVPYLLSLVSTPLYWDRYVVAAAPAFYLLVWRGVLAVPGRLVRGGLATLMVAAALAGLADFRGWQMEDWRALAERLDREAGDGDVIVVQPDWTARALRHYYRGRAGIVELPEGASAGEVRRAVAPAAARGASAWLVLRGLPGDGPAAGVLRRRFPGAEPGPAAAYGLILRARRWNLPSPAPSGPPDRGVILLVLDSVRADHLGAYGYGRPTTPNIDDFAAGGAVFERAYTAAAWTVPSVTTLLTSVYPVVHKVYDSPESPRFNVLPASFDTLAETLRERGFRTAALTSQPWFNAALGITAGFDQVGRTGDINDPLETEHFADAVIAWLEEHGDEPFFLYAHGMGAHAPYDAPLPFGGRFTAGMTPGPAGERVRRIMAERGGAAASAAVREMARRGEVTPADVAWMEARYDGKLAWVDHNLGRLFRYLEESGLSRRVAVILCADHGEAFLEHRNLHHTDSLHQELIRVPLILRLPGARGEGRRVGEVAELVDVYPTVLRILGLEPESPLMGRNLLPMLRGGKGDGVAYATGRDYKVVTGDWGAFFDYGKPLPRELYRLADDPLEKVDLVDREPAQAAEMGRLAREFWGEVGRMERHYRPAPRRAVLDEATRERLRSLGYAQ